MSALRILGLSVLLMPLAGGGPKATIGEMATFHPATGSVTEHRHTRDCEAYHRIVAARSDQPPFSSLGADDWPSSALSCELRSELEAPVFWGEVVSKPNYVCTFYASSVATPRQDGEAAWTELQGEAFTCFGDWEISAAASREDSEFGGHTVFSMTSADVPLVVVNDTLNIVPIWFDWRYQPDPSGDRPGHLVTFNVAAND